MTIDINVTVTLNLGAVGDALAPLIEAIRQLIQQSEDRIVSALSDKISEVGAALDAAIARVQSDVSTLNAKIAELQALVDQGTATPADMAVLEALKTKLEAIDPTQPTVLPPPVEPTPPVEPPPAP